MFLDLKESIRAVEELGDSEFLNFRKDFFSDLANPILSTEGEIYSYVGDEAVISWPLNPDPINNDSFLSCFTRFKKGLEKRSDRYRKRYNRLPEFKAVVHCGKVTVSYFVTVKKRQCVIK